MIEGDRSSALRDLLRNSLLGRSEPVVFAGGRVVAAAALWDGSLVWSRAFRDSGVRRGDRVIVVPSASPTTVEVIAACVTLGITVVPVPYDRASWAAAAVGARLAIAPRDVVDVPTWIGQGGPAHRPAMPRPAVGRSPAALLTPTPAGWFPQSPAALLERLWSSELEAMNGSRVVSTVSWDDPDGLFFGLLAPVMRSAALLVHVPDATAPELTNLLDEAAWCVIDAVAAGLLTATDAGRHALARCRHTTVINGGLAVAG